jgi:tetratricopeptide (TPR) repeat protein
MTSNSADLQRLLQNGVRAIQRGERERGREALLQVVALDEHNESAWLWLSRAVDAPDDIRTALENVLTLNPDNAEAKTRLEQLAQPGAPQDETHPDGWRSLLPSAPVEPEDGIDDPLQCVFCGQPTREADRTCPHCGQNLYVRIRQSHDSEYLRLGLLLLGILAALAVVQSGPPLLALSAAQGENKGGFEIIQNIPGFVYALGAFLQFDGARALTLVTIFGARAAVLFALLAGLGQRWTAAYFTAFLLLVGDVGLNAYLLFSGSVAVIGGLINAALGLVILYLLAASYQEFTVTSERLLTVPHPQAHMAGDFYKRGHDYGQAGMWALAVAQWRKAVGLAPKEASYYKTLGLGYAHIQRFERSLRVLEEAQRQNPNDRDLPKIITLVKEQAAKAKK